MPEVRLTHGAAMVEALKMRNITADVIGHYEVEDNLLEKRDMKQGDILYFKDHNEELVDGKVYILYEDSLSPRTARVFRNGRLETVGLRRSRLIHLCSRASM